MRYARLRLVKSILTHDGGDAAVADFDKAWSGAPLSMYRRETALIDGLPAENRATTENEWRRPIGQVWAESALLGPTVVSWIEMEVPEEQCPPAAVREKAWALCLTGGDGAQGLHVYHGYRPTRLDGLPLSSTRCLEWYERVGRSPPKGVLMELLEEGKRLAVGENSGPEVNIGLGMILEGDGQYEAAIQQYSLAQPMSVDDEFFLRQWTTQRFEGLARCEQALGRRERAVWCYLQAGANSTIGIATLTQWGIDIERLALSQLLPCAGGWRWNVVRPVQAIALLARVGSQQGALGLLRLLEVPLGRDDSIRHSCLVTLATIVSRHRAELPPSVVRRIEASCLDNLSSAGMLSLLGACRAVGMLRIRDAAPRLEMLQGIPLVRRQAEAALEALGGSRRP
jgi:hypothetical protein